VGPCLEDFVSYLEFIKVFYPVNYDIYKFLSKTPSLFTLFLLFFTLVFVLPLDEKLSNHKVVEKIMESMPKKYDHMVAAIRI
jgi:hypothetical protein